MVQFTDEDLDVIKEIQIYPFLTMLIATATRGTRREYADTLIEAIGIMMDRRVALRADLKKRRPLKAVKDLIRRLRKPITAADQRILEEMEAQATAAQRDLVELLDGWVDLLLQHHAAAEQFLKEVEGAEWPQPLQPALLADMGCRIMTAELRMGIWRTDAAFLMDLTARGKDWEQRDRARWTPVVVEGGAGGGHAGPG